MRTTPSTTYNSRAGKAVKRMFKLNIEGEYLDLVEVAARLGLSGGHARNRLRREQAKPGPVTWEGLRTK